MSPIQDVASYLIVQKDIVAEEIVHNIISELNIEVKEQDLQAGIIVYAALVELMAKSLIHPTCEIFAEVERWSRDLGEQAAQAGEKLNNTLTPLPVVRSAFIRYIGHICEENNVSVNEMLLIIERVNYTLDISINEVIKAHDTLKEQIIENARMEAIKLSAPIVPIYQGIAVLPLVGNFDEKRAEFIYNDVIPQTSEWNLKHLILDLSGIRTIDDVLMYHLIKIHNVLRLIGIHAILTGIRPALAQVAISAGLDFSNIETYLNMQQALERLST